MMPAKDHMIYGSYIMHRADALCFEYLLYYLLVVQEIPLYDKYLKGFMTSFAPTNSNSMRSL